MLTFKLADAPHEHAQIHALSYRAFVEEIPQHRPNDARLHVDRFHDENVYAISLEGERVVGMLAIRGNRPFSLDQKLPDLDRYLPRGRRPCEVRLLAIEKEHRTGAVLPGLLSLLFEHARAQRFDCAVISATTRQLKLYEHLGFVPFGPLVGTREAPFQPMLITLEDFQRSARSLAVMPPVVRGEVANFLTGPVAVHPSVAAAFHAPPESHRSASFLAELQALRGELRAMVHANHVAVLLGSGTLANDCVAAQLRGRGVVVSNGEFGERLADHASRAGLDFVPVRFEWGQRFAIDAIRRALDVAPAWLWVVACETSCGVMNDIDALQAIARETESMFCVDAVSAIGAVPLDLSQADFATGTSGKALGAFAGLSLVFHRAPVAPSANLPRYLDLGLYDGVPFTHSSNLVRALRAAVAQPRNYGELAELGANLRRRLAALGFTLAGDDPAPHVITIALPRHVRSSDVASRLERTGFLLGHASDYLRARNWLQIALMGAFARDAIGPLVRELRRAVGS